jgi:hypothetical protein
MYKDFKSKFNVLSEEFTSRFQSAGVLNGDFCIIRPDAIKNEKISKRGSQYIDKIKEYIASKLPLKVCAVQSERPETSNSIAGQGDLMTAVGVDVVQELAPGLWTQPMSLPLECIDVVMPDGNNWSPTHPEEWKRKDDTIIHPKEVKDATDDLQKQTAGKDRKLAKKNEKGGPAKEPKDGRDQVKKPDEYKRKTKKEAVEAIKDASELLAEVYDQLPMRGQ